MIEFVNVTKHYGRQVAVRDFSLRVPDKSVFALVGSSGCGKTTLLRMVNRMVTPTSGSVFLDEQDVAKQDPVQLRRSIGYVIQNGGLMPHHSVLRNIMTVPLLNGVRKVQAQETALEMMEKVGLDSALAKRFPAQLSGGQQQRVGVARALASHPKVLLMDEPFGAIDPVVRRELQDELLNLQTELAKTIILVTHDLAEAFRLADTVVMLQEFAQVAQVGTPEEIEKNPSNDFVKRMLETLYYRH